MMMVSTSCRLLSLVTVATYCVVVATGSNVQEQINEPTSLLRKQDDAYRDSTADDRPNDDTSSSSEIAWLMSFPNSGTSFTLDVIGRTSRTLVATNYCHESPHQTKAVIPAHDKNGPFWQNKPRYPEPTKYAITKTHCGYYCSACPPESYMQDADSFTELCSSGFKFVGDSNQKDKVHVTYDANVVRKAIHLIRNPFDNMVSRFHHARHETMSVKQRLTFPNSRHGFRKYCQHMNDKWNDEVELTWLTDELSMMKDIPCRDDLYRYVQWHNLAFRTTDDELQIPTHVLRYEQYVHRFDDTVDELLNFLHLEQRDEPYHFTKGHSYAGYYTDEEQRNVMEAFKILASNTTWQHLQHYFE